MTNTKLYRYEIHSSGSAIALDIGVVELTDAELSDSIDNPDWGWLEPDEGKDYGDDDNDREITATYYRAPDGADMSKDELIEAATDELIEVGWVSDWLSNIFAESDD